MDDDDELDDDTVVTETDDDNISDDDANDDGLGDDTETPTAAATSAVADNATAGITPAKMAKNALRKANKKENAGTITLFGDPTLVGGVTVDLKNFGAFDEKYIVSKATHKISDGYTVESEIRKCLNGY